MEIGKTSLSGNFDQKDNSLPTPAADEKSAMALFQARYGEKQKEARAVKKTLDKDDFMKIMITEMKHQDPTKPMDSDRMATQMAQITSIEQMKNVGNSLEKMSEKNTASDRLAMSMMIGKTVTVDKSRFSHQKATVSPISFDLPEASDKIKLTILDDRGEEVASRELEPMEAGPNTYLWDGMNTSNIQAPSSVYSIRIDAENKNGSKIKINPIAKENVVGVTFEGGESNFLIGNPKNPQKVSLRNITRLEGESQANSIKPALRNPHESKAVDQNDLTGGTGKEFALPAAVKEKLGLDQPEGEAALKASQSQLTASDDSTDQGFPNGLEE